MRAKNKAILLSALVLPGLGQLTLKRYKLGAIILVTVVISFYKVITIATQRANEIVNDMLSQSGALDMQAISHAAQSAGNSSYDFYVWLMIACWIISIVDILFAKKTGTSH